MISYIEKKIEEILCVLKNGQQKIHSDRKIPFYDLNESKSLPFNHLLKLYFWILCL